MKLFSIVLLWLLSSSLLAQPSEPVTILAIDRQGGLPQFLMERKGSLYSFAHLGDSILENKVLGIRLTFPHGLRGDYFTSIARNQLSDFGFSFNHFVFIRLIFFDYNSALIRNDASAELDKLAELMLSYPFAEVEAVIHTDSRGSVSYNQKLAAQRGNSVANYIREAGVNSRQLKIKVSGEESLVTDCINAQDCDEQIHQFNRRAEFIFKPIVK